MYSALGFLHCYVSWLFKNIIRTVPELIRVISVLAMNRELNNFKLTILILNVTGDVYKECRGGCKQPQE